MILLIHAEADRPIILTQDNLGSHLGIELIRFCRDKRLELVCFPPKTTHVLQPADAVFHLLKLRFSEISRTANMANGGSINKSKFSGTYILIEWSLFLQIFSLIDILQVNIYITKTSHTD